MARVTTTSGRRRAAIAADGGKLALLFPGVEATFAADVGEVARELGVALPASIAAANAAAPNELEARGRGVFAVGRLLAAALARLGVAPDAIAGHSMGEWTGMVASRDDPPRAVDAFLGELPPSLDVPDVVFAAVGCGAAGASTALEGLDAIGVSHDNCPHQAIVCGRVDAVRVALERLAQRGVMCQELLVPQRGFHSPLFADYVAPHRARIATLALQRPRIPLWSATIAAPYPAAPDAVRDLAIAHLTHPVRFRELVRRALRRRRARVRAGRRRRRDRTCRRHAARARLPPRSRRRRPSACGHGATRARAPLRLWTEGFIAI